MNRSHCIRAISAFFVLLITTASHAQQNAPGGVIQNGPNSSGTVINNNAPPPPVVYTVCSGEYEGKCQAHDAYLYCYEDVKAWANARCGSALVQRVNTYGGNKCGYSIDKIICTNPHN
jgi:hypothetical protein